MVVYDYLHTKPEEYNKYKYYYFIFNYFDFNIKYKYISYFAVSKTLAPYNIFRSGIELSDIKLLNINNLFKYNVLQLDNNVALLFIPKNDSGQLIFGNKFSMAIGIMHCYIGRSFLNRERCEQVSFERYNIDFDLLKDSLKHLNEGLYRIDKKYQLSFNIYNQFIEYNLAQNLLVDLKNSF